MTTDYVDPPAIGIIEPLPMSVVVDGERFVVGKQVPFVRGIVGMDPFELLDLSVETRFARMSAVYGATILDQTAQTIHSKSESYAPRRAVEQVLEFQYMKATHLLEDNRFVEYWKSLKVLCAVFGYCEPQREILSDTAWD